MAAEKEDSHWSSYAILAAAGLGMFFMIWRSYVNDAPRSAPRQAAPMTPQIETTLSLGALAESHFSARRYEEAITVYRKILAHDPKDASAYNDLGLALYYSDKPEEAVAALKQATTLAPG
ncbi:MAG: tetratricopeptide repeat protein, partial [Elusimicrobiota bacterium]